MVTGVDGTQYQLALNADKTELHAVGKDLTGTAVASAITADNLVASLSDANNNDVTFANTAVAKNLLKPAVLIASMQLWTSFMKMVVT